MMLVSWLRTVPLQREPRRPSSLRTVRDHLLVDPLERLLRLEAPVGRTGGEHLDQREALALDLIFKGLFDAGLGVFDIFDLVDGHAGEIRGRVERGEQLADADGVALGLDVAAVGGGLRDLSGQARRGHLAAGHAVDGVVGML